MLFLLHLSGAAVYYDVRYQRIPNGLIITGLLLGFVYQISRLQLMGLAVFGAGIVLPVVLLSFLYYFRMMGAGDIKLLAMIGGFLGPADGLLCIFYTFLFGGVIAVGLLFKRRIFIKRILYFQMYVIQYLQTGQWCPYIRQEDRECCFCFSIPVFLSLTAYLGGVY